MKKILNFILLSSIFILILVISSCSEDDPSPTQQVPVITEKEYGAFVLCSGNDQYPPERYLGYYDINKNTFKLNVFRQGDQFSKYPVSIAYSNGQLYVSTSAFNNTAFPKLFVLHAWGENKGNVIREESPSFKVGVVLPFGSNIAVTYWPDYYLPIGSGTMEIRNINSYSWLYNYQEMGSFISSIEYYNSKLFLLFSNINSLNIDSSLASVTPFENNLTKVSLRSKPTGMIITNAGELIVACSGSSNMVYHIDPGTLTKTDSTILNGGFNNKLRYYSGSPFVYYISKDDKIMKYNPASKTSVVFLNNEISTEGYSISGYNIDKYTGKHYVLYSNINAYKPGKLRIYSQNGFFERMFDTGKSPIDIIIEKQP